MPPVMHVDTDAPLHSDVDGSLITDEIWGIYYKPDFHFNGVQGGARPEEGKKRGEEGEREEEGEEGEEGGWRKEGEKRGGEGGEKGEKRGEGKEGGKGKEEEG